ncbi:MAG: septum formation initiator family protein [Terracidiphilus sp.]|nr:septum formation initiator family protein [Terracidiphilus sp.]MDR3797805.1 septum formation initiator family protein [Terracidiphilus sp.]
MNRDPMPEETSQQSATKRGTPAANTKPAPLGKRTLIWAQRLWRPAGTVIAVALALLVTWHVIYGRHGISVWQQKRAEDRALQQEIRNLQEENAQMRQQIQRLQSDPEAIEREAREKLHYAKPGDVIVVSSPAPPQPPGK